MSAGYAARGRDGIHELLDIETARATADTFTTLHDDLTHGAGISGPAARRAIAVENQFLRQQLTDHPAVLRPLPILHRPGTIGGTPL